MRRLAGTGAVIGVMALSFVALGGVGEALGKRGETAPEGCRRASCTTVTTTRTLTTTVRETATVTGTETATERTRALETITLPAATEVRADATVTSVSTVPGQLVVITSTSTVPGTTTSTVATTTTTATQTTDTVLVSTETRTVRAVRPVTSTVSMQLFCSYDTVIDLWLYELQTVIPADAAGRCPFRIDVGTT